MPHKADNCIIITFFISIVNSFDEKKNREKPLSGLAFLHFIQSGKSLTILYSFTFAGVYFACKETEGGV